MANELPLDQQLGQMYELMKVIRKSQVDDANGEGRDEAENK